MTIHDDANGDDGEDPDNGAGDVDRSPWRFRGSLSARAPDAQGRIYGFSYHLRDDHDRVRMRVVGRGSWSPAPGVVIEDPDHEGFALIGTGSYCVVDVDVHEYPHEEDALLVGNETWFLSRDTCLRHRTGFLASSPRCSDMKR